MAPTTNTTRSPLLMLTQSAFAQASTAKAIVASNTSNIINLDDGSDSISDVSGIIGTIIGVIAIAVAIYYGRLQVMELRHNTREAEIEIGLADLRSSTVSGSGIGQEERMENGPLTEETLKTDKRMGEVIERETTEL